MSFPVLRCYFAVTSLLLPCFEEGSGDGKTPRLTRTPPSKRVFCSGSFNGIPFTNSQRIDKRIQREYRENSETIQRQYKEYKEFRIQRIQRIHAVWHDGTKTCPPHRPSPRASFKPVIACLLRRSGIPRLGPDWTSCSPSSRQPCHPRHVPGS